MTHKLLTLSCAAVVHCQVLSVDVDVPSTTDVSVSYRILTPANTFASHTSRYGRQLHNIDFIDTIRYDTIR